MVTKVDSRQVKKRLALSRLANSAGDTVEVVLDNIDSKIVLSPSASTTNAIPKFSSTSGKDLTPSSVIIDNSNNITGIASETVATSIVTGISQENISTDSTTTGSNTTLTSFTTPIIRLTNASLISLDMIPAGTQGQSIKLVNATGAAFNVDNETGATAANRILTGTNSALSLANNASIILTYDTISSRWRIIGGSGSGSGSGGINYILSPSADIGLVGWATYADAAATSPVDGTGGAPNVTFTTTTSTPLRGTASFLFTKDAVNRQGQGFSYDFTIDSSDKGKVLQGSFEYQIASGTYADNDMSFWIYDITNARLIALTPSNLKNSGIIEKLGMEFQTSIDSTSYRLIGHIASTSALAYTIRFDTFNVGPQAKLYGSAVTDWVSYTPTGSWVTNTTYSGFKRRNGDTEEYQVTISLTGAPTSANLTINLPSGESIDGTKMNISTSNTVGNAYIVSAANGYQGLVTPASSTAVAVIAIGTASTYSNLIPANVTQAVPATFANGDLVRVSFRVPIVGWSSSQIMSSDADTRVVAFESSVVAQTPAALAVTTPFSLGASAVVDTNGGYNGSNSYTVKVPGLYIVKVYGDMGIAASSTANQMYQITAYKNGVAIVNFASRSQVAVSLNNWTGSNLDVVSLVAGDVITANVNTNFTTPGTTAFVNLSVTRISGPASIAASESVSALYTGAPPTIVSGTLAAATAVLSFGTKVKDSHNAYNTTTGVYTIPMSGTYDISAITSQNGTYILNGQVEVGITIDGVFKAEGIITNGGATNTAQPLVILKSYPLLAGQLVNVRGYNSGTTPTFATTGTQNQFSIVRTGQY